jgi:hypothetical protein
MVVRPMGVRPWKAQTKRMGYSFRFRMAPWRATLDLVNDLERGT